MKNFFKKIKPSTYLQLGLIAILFLFLVLPLIFMLFKVGGNDLNYVFNDENFYKAIGNSIIYSLAGSLITTILATIVAYYLSRLRIKGKKWIIILLTIPMLIPTISVGLGVRSLFGTSGFLDQLFGIKYDGLGFFDLILGSVNFSFPVAFLLIYDAFLYEDRSIYDASNTLGISRINSFFGITLPYLKTTLISAFFASFTLIFADYGLPMEVAGKVKTLPMYLYEEVLSSFNYGRGAVISLVLLLPALVAFIFDVINKDNGEGAARKENIKPSKTFTTIGLVVVILVAVILMIPQVSFIAISFVTRFPGDMTFTFNNYKDAFSPYSSVSIVKFLSNSLIISLLAGLFGTIVAYLTGYLSTRAKGKLAKPLHLLSIATLAVPGLVLGIGYVFLFNNTDGWFSGTIIILVVVNIIHYFSSPYLMAKNAFNKVDKNYETVADTLGISKISLFFKVMVPNTIETIMEMFSYLFINSMITISAVSFLATYSTQPLAVSITTYENQAIYEMESVVSTIILFINLIAKIGFDLLKEGIKKISKGKAEEKMELTRFQFQFLTYIEQNNMKVLTQRQIADGITLSLGTTNKLFNQFVEDDVIILHKNKKIELTEKGYKLLEPYKVRKAIIIAAGFGSRMVPVTLDTPKPLVKVNGVRIIDTLLDALYAKDIKNITIVVGYLKEQFQELLEKYPTLKFIENPIYNESNNISSMYVARDIIDRCYICEADLVVSNPEVITKYQYCSNYLGAHVSETDDWCFFKKHGYIDRVSIGGEDCWHMIGISYWNEKDSTKLREDIDKVYHSRGGKEKYWDNVPLTMCKKDFKIEVRECLKSDVTEIDNYSELVIIDPTYKNYKHK
ncbi:MAG: ABC transporter permease subunit [Bacilli bacterium]|nr:ABC transporter permease subunit [Bacilli bacterium]